MRPRIGLPLPSVIVSRRGLALLAAMVCIVILSALAIGLVRTVLARIKEANLNEHQLQADALAQSAIERGLARRAADASYAREVWTPAVPGAPPMQAEIQNVVTPSGGTIRVTCLVPADAARPVRVEREAPVPSTLPMKAESP